MASPLTVAAAVGGEHADIDCVVAAVRGVHQGTAGIAGEQVRAAAPADRAGDVVTAAVRIARHVARDIAIGRDRRVDGAMGIRDDGVVAAPSIVDHRLGIAHHDGGVPAAADIGDAACRFRPWE